MRKVKGPSEEGCGWKRNAEKKSGRRGALEG